MPNLMQIHFTSLINLENKTQFRASPNVEVVPSTIIVRGSAIVFTTLMRTLRILILFELCAWF